MARSRTNVPQSENRAATTPFQKILYDESCIRGCPAQLGKGCCRARSFVPYLAEPPNGVSRLALKAGCKTDCNAW